MSSLSLLDVAIAMVFFFLLLSLVCSAANEIFAALLQTRARFLERGLRRLLVTEDFTALLYNHPLIQPLGDVEPWFQGKLRKRLPSYIPSRTFALAVMDLIKTSEPEVPANVRRALDALVQDVTKDAVTIRQSIEDWYNSAMERVSSAYKRRTQYVLFGLGIVAAMAVNADSVAVIERLATSQTLSTVVAAAAEQYQRNTPDGNAEEKLESTLLTLDRLGLPIGWTGPGKGNLFNPDGANPLRSAVHLLKIHWIGWLITGLAVSFGAPFWFDVLNRFITVRSAIKPEGKPKPQQ